MKRQFCRYLLYQKDVMRSEVDYNSPALEETDASWTGATVRIGDKLYKVVPESYTYKVDTVVSGTHYWVAQRTFEENGETKLAYNVTWKSVFDQSTWSDWTAADETEAATDETLADRKVEVSTGVYKKAPKYYKQALSLQGKVLNKLMDCHFNRMVKIDVVYEVIPDEFQFAYRGRNTTAWYQMMTNNSSGGLMNFSYKDGIGARTGQSEHYTNNYLWAPEGDPYGFVLRSRYATINGSGWHGVAVTTNGSLPKDADDTYSDGDAGLLATYTSGTPFNEKRIIHALQGEPTDDSGTAPNDGLSNPIYEMFTGDAAFTNSFIMHPTTAYINTTDADFKSYYMIHDTGANTSKLSLESARDLQTNADANWSLRATAEQLLPYFERAGYVGGIDPEKAMANFNYQDYYDRLNTARDNGTSIDFSTLRKIQEIVYSGTFYQNDGVTEVTEGSARPEQADLPMRFKATNLVNMTDGYYRLAGFSTAKLNAAEGAEGIQGQRYVSGYRFASEQTNSKPLRFFETNMNDATIHTYADLTDAKDFSDRTTEDPTPSDAVLQGNIELLPADFDPSSIFRFQSVNDNGVERYTLSTQGLNVQASVGSTSMSTSGGTKLRLDDIGGAAVTLRTLSVEPTGTAWDTEVKTTLQTNYLTSAGDNYSLTVTANNELNQTTTTDIQDTKWVLQPVGIHEDWPYNEMPLRVEMQKGGVDRSGNEDKYYYGSLYVPFDTRLGNTTDAAFTLTSDPPEESWGTTSDPGTVTMSSVSRLNDMGNPQFVPANWPVVLRTKIETATDLKKKKIVLKNQDESDYATRYYVNMYIPNITPTVIPNALDGTQEIKLSGQYLEQTLSEGGDKTIMVFGLPYVGGATHSSHEYDTDQSVGFFTNDNWAREIYSDYKAHSGSYAASTTTGSVATDSERDNKYVYHNKIYYVLDYPGSMPAKQISYSVAIFDGDEMLGGKDNAKESEETEDADYSEDSADPWPCDVYDLQGRRVARNETPETLRHNHPGLPKGVYIFGHKKVIVK